MIPAIATKLQSFRKNISYPTAPTPSYYQAVLECYSDQRISDNVFAAQLWQWMRAQHRDMGVQFVVQKRVSDDLVLTDVEDIDFADCPWLADSVEFFFEDPDLPTCLMQRAGATLKRQIADLPLVQPLGAVRKEGFDTYVHVVVPRFDDKSVDSMMTAKEMTQLVQGQALEDLQIGRDSLGSNAIYQSTTDEDVEGLRIMARLCYKVMLYAAVPILEPKQITKRMMSHGGRPGVKNRPNRPIYHVVDLPVIVREQLANARAAENDANSRDFRGRRGHFHYYRSDRFINRQGSFDYFPPVFGPDGTLPVRKFRVRKVEAPKAPTKIAGYALTGSIANMLANTEE